MTFSFSADSSRPRIVRRRSDWRDGGRTVKRWDAGILGIALTVFGAGLLISALMRGFDPRGAAPLLADVILLLSMMVPIVYAFARSRPRPLLRMRPVDVVYGLGLGLILRAIQGMTAAAAGADGAFPRYEFASSAEASAPALFDIAAFVLVAPIVEELFLRGVLLVTTYSVVRRLTEKREAWIAALMLSTLASIAAHAWTSGWSWEAWVSPAAVGLVCGLLVLCTGRIWGAVLTHLVFNVTFTVLALVGTQWA